MDGGPDPTACGLSFLTHHPCARDAESSPVTEAGDSTLETANAKAIRGDRAGPGGAIMVKCVQTNPALASPRIEMIRGRSPGSWAQCGGWRGGRQRTRGVWLFICKDRLVSPCVVWHFRDHPPSPQLLKEPSPPSPPYPPTGPPGFALTAPLEGQDIRDINWPQSTLCDSSVGSGSQCPVFRAGCVLLIGFCVGKISDEQSFSN